MKTWLFLILVMLPGAMALDLNDAQVVLGDGDRETLSDDFSGQEVTVSDVDMSQPLVVIGGPCATTLWEQYSELTCESWPYDEGMGIVLSVDEGRVLLIAGTTQEDTERLVGQVLGGRDLVSVSGPEEAREIDEELSTGDQFVLSEDAIVFVEGETVSFEDVSIIDETLILAVEDTTYTLKEGQQFPIQDITFMVQELDEESATISVYEVDGTDEVNDDDADDTNDDADTEEVTVQEGEEESVSIGDEDMEIASLSISDDALDVTIDGTAFSSLEEGDSRTVNGIEFEVTGISDDEATFRFEE